MRIVKTRPAWVRCEPPRGCGWWYRLRLVRRHWWSRRHLWALGPYFPDGGGAARWQLLRTVMECNSDCVPHMTFHHGPAPDPKRIAANGGN